MLKSKKKNITKLILALDYKNLNSALYILNNINPQDCKIKIGLEMFIRFGPKFVQKVQNLGFDVFLDLKFFDIPNTVAKSVRSSADLGVWMISLHAIGGEIMLQAAKNAIEIFKKDSPILIAVTILTSFNDKSLSDLNFNNSIRSYVLNLSKIAKNCGMDGIVCPGTEVLNIKKNIGLDLKLITPGIRSSNYIKDDQKQTITLKQAKKYGINYIVIGRPITASTNPLTILNKILKKL
ncbi:orotidine-5'-phosphate decarboxylase [Buchnera aphidicola (Neophyllaphis podocarpi)]|uniref:orotidine-5'-phosphate decarboxylase n=1 Tax=Buchnera aphidicola TaxID=9 RepID=UPI0031B85DB5